MAKKLKDKFLSNSFKILKKELRGILQPDEIKDIKKKMSESWNNIIQDWGNVCLDNLTKDEYKKRINRLAEHFSIYLTDKVKLNVIKSNYEKCFAHVQPSDNPLILIVAGAIASGKSTVANYVVPEKYGSDSFGVINKDVLKASTIFRELINNEFGEENGNLIRDYMLPLRESISLMAIANKKSILLEQSCKTTDFLDTCEYAIRNNYKIYAEIVITPLAFTCLRNGYRYVTGLIKDQDNGTNSARYEAFVNIEGTYHNAPLVLNKLEKIAENMTVYTADLLKTDITGKTMQEVFLKITNGSVSDVLYEISVRMLNFIDANINYIANSDIVRQLNFAREKLSQLSDNPGLIYKAMPQEWQTKSLIEQLDELNAPLGFGYSERLMENASESGVPQLITI